MHSTSSSNGSTQQRLHWTQRIALVRHNLHSARRTNDFTFFKSLQAHALLEGTDHVALLQYSLGDQADSVLSTLDNLNAGIAYVHQDAFKAVYDGAKAAIHADDRTNRRSLLHVDICQQRDMADLAIDKTTNSAVNLIQSQPIPCQDAVANAWITGTTIIADAVCVCLNEMNQMEHNMDDFILLEYSWNLIQSSVDSAISALRGIFSLMAVPNTSNNNFPLLIGRNMSTSSAGSEHNNASTRSRNSSTASAFSFIKRALSHGQIQPPQFKNPRTGSVSLSVASPEANSRGFRASISAACPTKMSTFGSHPHTVLTTIPPTPSVHDVGSISVGGNVNGLLSPFMQNGDYFPFDMGKQSEKDDKESSAIDDLMNLGNMDEEHLDDEDLDPLSPAPMSESIQMPAPLTLRTLSDSFEMSPATPIAV
ncbi:hypothetical protein IAQ61_006586 [Plenodomus lingam]|uniref:Uncharacterized protein n=1 Tax=Leptosphaeria maculans (strain JN3 / isolate v23.1.3 / race Av1-4-5-6-7-8) TaxID=985895 RepID=E5AFK7_LEPMJ|nr:hypothetical protein LEMA_P007830.1 [Plenodomus lingam JN3]KAH9869380.1 hypothetical protein IAQ61_006586 [Plenodomus lingam]CBY01996.1 hypothetical protein LEMA_P007830.1 [Plenodomus lingam JN3]